MTVGEDTTLTVALRTVGVGVAALYELRLGDNPDGVFLLLEPSSFGGSPIDGESAFAFVAVNAPAPGSYSVDVEVSATAINAPDDGSPVVVTLNVNASAP